MPSTRTCQGCDAFAGAVGILRILLGRIPKLVAVSDRHQPLLLHSIPDGRVRKVDAALAVRNPDAEPGARHSTEEHAIRLSDHDVGEATLVASRVVLHKARLPPARSLVQLADLTAWHPAHQGHELAAVAHAETEGVFATAEVLKHGQEARIHHDARCPALGAVHHVREAEATHERDAPEASVNRYLLGKEITHRDIPRLESGGQEGSRHLPVAVRSLLAEDRHPRLLRQVQHLQRGCLDRVGQLKDKTLLVLGNVLSLHGHAAQVRLLLLESERRALPGLIERSERSALDHRLIIDHDLDGPSSGSRAQLVCMGACSAVQFHNLGGVRGVNFNDEARLFVEERPRVRCAERTRGVELGR
eukprot:scaffold125_cov240-Pinguiococcus_pyrenoidosus.AAC.6